jgi:hypothetical protein
MARLEHEIPCLVISLLGYFVMKLAQFSTSVLFVAACGTMDQFTTPLSEQNEHGYSNSKGTCSP